MQVIRLRAVFSFWLFLVDRRYGAVAGIGGGMASYIAVLLE